MVAKIATNSRLDKSLNYNEKKLENGQAELILANGFLKDMDRLTFYEKMERFERQNDLNPDSKVNTMHTKVSFDPSEKETLTNEQLAKIAERYMQGIGFGDQPYLVYYHKDTDVPHIHILSTMIDSEGNRIRDFNIAKDKSEPTRKAIEEEFGLVKAADHAKKVEYELAPVNAEKIIHGEKPTKQAIQNTLHSVLKEYNVTSLSELNAVLRQYNIMADPGEEGSRTKQYRGLSYKVLDEKGDTAGIPIKASDFYFKPTLDKLEEKFESDRSERKEKLSDLRSKIDVTLAQQPENLKSFLDALSQANIDVVVWQGEGGRIYGMTYVDHDLKIGAKGSDLGKAYSGGAISERFGNQEALQPDSPFLSKDAGKYPSNNEQSWDGFSDGVPKPQKWPADIEPTGDKMDALFWKAAPETQDWNLKSPQVLSGLLKLDGGGEDIPKELKKDKRQRRRKSL
ncbi:MAG: relaxase/mobilization nuclease domain-containing protein [Puia sp.]|nr:relaxase/mobilization nuclease domain-containing protein [Puia sp.]